MARIDNDSLDLHNQLDALPSIPAQNAPRPNNAIGDSNLQPNPNIWYILDECKLMLKKLRKSVVACKYFSLVQLQSTSRNSESSGTVQRLLQPPLRNDFAFFRVTGS